MTLTPPSHPSSEDFSPEELTQAEFMQGALEALVTL
jgi:hypothetical protein